MADKGLVIVYKGERKNLRGRYSNGSCILTPNGWFLYNGGWMRMVVDEENSRFDFNTGDCVIAYTLEPIKM